MKTIIEINGSNYGSSGKIALDIASKARESGFVSYTLVLKSRESIKHLDKYQVLFGLWFERILSERLSLLTGLRDSFNIFGTFDLIRKIKQMNPDLIHLHLLHDNFINLEILFSYINKKRIPIVWTFHDCWPITGQCPAFEMIDCEKWKKECNNCPQWKNPPKSLLFDTSKLMWNRKKRIFSNINNLTIITPSDWLKNTIMQSFLKNHNIETIYNGIDLDTFKYFDCDIRNRLNIKDKHIILGVANYWEKRKGLDVFIELAKFLPNNYQIILVGTNEYVDNMIPSNIISIHKTFNQKELSGFYSVADVFVNPTREDVFGLVNVEALACGTPVIVYKTGGCPEIIDESCGIVIEKNNIKSLIKSIIYICNKRPFSKENCFARAKQFDKNYTYNKYIDLYKEKLNIK